MLIQYRRDKMGMSKENSFEAECNLMQDLGFSLTDRNHWLRWTSEDTFTLEEQDKIEKMLNELRNGYECDINFVTKL